MLRRIVLDVLKPYEPTIIELSYKLSSVKNVEGVNIVTYEIDKEVENVKITIEGKGFDFKKISKILEYFGAAIHSIDEVATGEKLVEEASIPSENSAGWLR